MRIVKVECQGKPGDRCQEAYQGCKERVMYSDSDHKITCNNGNVKVSV